MNSDIINPTKTRVRLELHAHGLKNVAGAFKGTSDPFAIVAVLGSTPNEKPIVLGKTEVIKNSLNPRWTHYFDLDYELSKNTRINVGIWDEVRKSSNKPMGSALFEIGEVIGARGNTKAKKLRHGGTLFVRITPAPVEIVGTLHLNLRGVHLKNVDGLFGKSDPFFEISANTLAAGGITWQPVYRSKPVMNNLNPNWEPFSLDLGRLCAGDLNRPILFELWDWDKAGKHTNMGRFETCVSSLISSIVAGAGGSNQNIDISKAFLVTTKNGKVFGKIVVTTAKLEGFNKNAGSASTLLVPQNNSLSRDLKCGSYGTSVSASASAPFANAPTAPFNTLPPPIPPPSIGTRPRFVDYLTGGCELELSIAVDFTGSNGDPRVPGTLHYRYPNGQFNDYEKAITAVGGILGKYDSDQLFSCFGFGAKYGGVIQHCFQMGDKPKLDGIQGVLDAYRSVFRSGLTMSGPTVFAEVIDYVAATAISKQESMIRNGQQSYTILLILTDGAVTDVEETKRAVRAATEAPLSIVVVGIGSADFSAMHHLDDFGEKDPSIRDILQFVEFSHHANDKSSLTRATLEEIPDQLVHYFYSRGMKPLPAVTESQLNLQPEEATEEDIDLSIDISPEGEINLTNYDGTYYDDQKYNTMADYSTVVVIPPPTVPCMVQQPKSVVVPSQNTQFATASVPPEFFHVQVPVGVTPGTPLLIQHPKTGQQMQVFIPQGVAPGGKFAVSY